MELVGCEMKWICYVWVLDGGYVMGGCGSGWIRDLVDVVQAGYGTGWEHGSTGPAGIAKIKKISIPVWRRMTAKTWVAHDHRQVMAPDRQQPTSATSGGVKRFLRT